MFRTGPVTTQTSQPLQKNLFLQSLDDDTKNELLAEVQDKDIVECLENEVQYWTDFSKVHYHPQSLYEICGLWTNIKDFNNYGIGREAFSGGLHAEQVNERLRFFLEECDHPQVVLLHNNCSYIFPFTRNMSGIWNFILLVFLHNIQNFCELHCSSTSFMASEIYYCLSFFFCREFNLLLMTPEDSPV